MASRLYNQPAPKTSIKTPQNHSEWHSFMLQVIDRAARLEDRRLPGLRKAMAEGKVEKHLRMLGIISTADVLREFPERVI